MPSKRVKIFGSNIIARNGTMLYEYGKALHTQIPQFSKDNYPVWLIELINKKECIYCNCNIKSNNKTKGDHLDSIICNKKPRQLNNFSNFTLPCCSNCNSSKGKLTWEEFLNKNSKLKTNIKCENFKKIDNFIQNNIIYWYYDDSEFENIESETTDFLQYIADKVKNIKLYKYEQELNSILIDE